MDIFETILEVAGYTALGMWFYCWLDTLFYNRAVEKRRREQEHARKWYRVTPMRRWQ